MNIPQILLIQKKKTNERTKKNKYIGHRITLIINFINLYFDSVQWIICVQWFCAYTSNEQTFIHSFSLINKIKTVDHHHYHSVGWLVKFEIEKNIV